MKLRQKLAVVLASAMVITSVPVVTMAASTNTLTKETMSLAKDDITTESAVKVEFKDSKAGQKEVFYLELDNAEWALEGQTLPEGIKYEQQTDEIVKVTYTLTKDSEKVYFPIMAKVTGGEAKVAVVSKGGNTTVTSSTFVFATTADGEAIVTAKQNDMPTLYTEGTIAEITIKESMKDAFKNLDDDEREVELTIDNDDFEFAQSTLSADQIKFAYGFAGQGNDVASVKTRINSKDKQTLIVTLPADLKSDSIGHIKLVDVKVKSTEKKPTTGDLTLSVDGDAVKATDSIKVAEINAYGSKIEIEEDDEVEIKAGDKDEVIFTLKETEQSSFVNGRDMEFTIDKGFFIPQVEDKDGDLDEAKTIEKLKEVVKIRNTELNKNLEITDIEVNDDDKVIGFTATMVSDTEVKDEIEVKAKITAGLEEEGDVTVKVEGRALEKEISSKITTIKKVVTVTTEAATLKVGLQGQLAGKITLTEAEKGGFKSGKDIVLTIPVEKGITVKEVPTVKTTAGDIQMDEAKLSKVKTDSEGDKYVEITIPVKRTSKTASTIEISNIEFTTDRTVAEGEFDITLGGTALSPISETIELEGFLVVGTPNTEDLSTSNGLAKGTAKFVIGEATYTTNGVAKEMDAQSYVQDPGYTMVPVRYVAEAFGVKANDILFSNGTATIFAGNRTIQLTAGSNVAVVNGAAVTMGTKVVVKEGRTYAPVGEIARILGISTQWDSATKTATFENK
ncbi:stalk domain-containing protein [Cellulosilyticum ruminicola]|uniref:stalk domain-containing protein n=1 Tax=Cellulosilyticum ruminicola TaxID=425254 RepID=UPI0006CFCAD2|nr:stalk domain-containing protein [Cellulosilyticum ruminicola]